MTLSNGKLTPPYLLTIYLNRKELIQLILVGFMGVGKTTIGRLLAKKLGLAFVDIDRVIIEETQRSLAELFEERGETAFHQLELDMLKKYIGQAVVLSTGGGCVESVAIRNLLKAQSQVVFLNGSFDQIYPRIAPNHSNRRPTVTNKSRQQLETLYLERWPLYEEVADLRVETEDLSPWQIVQMIKRLTS